MANGRDEKFEPAMSGGGLARSVLKNVAVLRGFELLSGPLSSRSSQALQSPHNATSEEKGTQQDGTSRHRQN